MRQWRTECMKKCGMRIADKDDSIQIEYYEDENLLLPFHPSSLSFPTLLHQVYHTTPSYCSPQSLFIKLCTCSKEPHTREYASLKGSAPSSRAPLKCPSFLKVRSSSITRSARIGPRPIFKMKTSYIIPKY